MFPYVDLFGAAVAVSPLVILLAIWFGASLSENHAARFKTNQSNVYNLIFLLLFSYLIGGRVSYAVQHPAAFIEDPASLISRNFGLFDPLGGALIAILAAAINGQRKGMTLWPTLDALTPAIMVLLIAIPLANFASGEAFGAPSNLPWAVDLWGASRHPVQIYEALAAAGILIWLWPARLPEGKNTPGTYFFQFVAASAFARLVFEGLRGASPVTLLDLRIPQVAAWLMLATALHMLYYRSKPAKEVEE
jgi:phosphatidylglycerol:prolipoprotein diacylglycerol transferase